MAQINNQHDYSVVEALAQAVGRMHRMKEEVAVYALCPMCESGDPEAHGLLHLALDVFVCECPCHKGVKK